MASSCGIFTTEFGGGPRPRTTAQHGRHKEFVYVRNIANDRLCEAGIFGISEYADRRSMGGLFKNLEPPKMGRLLSVGRRNNYAPAQNKVSKKFNAYQAAA